MENKHEIPRELSLPKSIFLYEKKIEELCFRKNDHNLLGIDTIFVFGSVSSLENLKDAILYILNKAPIHTILISGGVSKKTTPLSEAQVIFNAIKNILPSDIKIILEQEATNTKENIEFSLKKYPELRKGKICFVSKYFAAGRSFLTLKKFLPQVLIKQYAFISNETEPHLWIQNKKSQSLVWAEVVRIFAYGSRGDIAYDDVKDVVEFLIKE